MPFYRLSHALAQMLLHKKSLSRPTPKIGACSFFDIHTKKPHTVLSNEPQRQKMYLRTCAPENIQISLRIRFFIVVD